MFWLPFALTAAVTIGCRGGEETQPSTVSSSGQSSSGTGAAGEESTTSTSDEPEAISADFPFESHYVDVLGSRMHYIDEGEGDEVILFLHGNPESVYAWRNVIPHVTPHARVVAVDLIGMGDSDKPELAYDFVDHARYLEAFIDTLQLEHLILVGHDWGTGLQFHYATRHQDNVEGLVFMEAVLDVDSWANHTPEYRELYEFLRSEAGRDVILEENVIVDPGIPDDVIRSLTEEEMDAYRRPFAQPEDRLLTWKWVTEIPIEGQPTRMDALVREYNAVLMQWDLPMLLLYAEPGEVYSPEVARGFADQLVDGEAVSVGPGLHYLAEDQPHAIGRAIERWYLERD